MASLPSALAGGRTEAATFSDALPESIPLLRGHVVGARETRASISAEQDPAQCQNSKLLPEGDLAPAEDRRQQPIPQRNVVFLTCDANGVIPPIARLTPEQAIYHFLSGYTSKIAGTEIGLGAEPEITFSTCFGGPFMVRHPYAYGELLKTRLLKYGVTCWLVNTGWTGGPFGIGKRISIRHTRALLDAALTGKLTSAEYRTDPVFGFDVPLKFEGVPPQILDPAGTWPSREAYDSKYRALAARFIENFKLIKDGCPENVAQGGTGCVADGG